MRVLFLDFDGVLNSTQTDFLSGFDFEKYPFVDSVYDLKFDGYLINVLNKVISFLPEVKIVISSSWRTHYTLEEIKNRMYLNGFKYATRIVGITPHTQISRGMDIKEYCHANGIDEYCILDDSNDMLPEQMERFVQTNELIGLNIIDGLKVIQIFYPDADIIKKYDYV